MACTPKDILDALYLFSQDQHTRDYTIGDFTQNVVTPLMKDRAFFFYSVKQDGNTYPAGLTVWCWLSNEKSELFRQGLYSPVEEDYDQDSGDKLWGIFMLAPFGHIRQVYGQAKQRCRDVYGPNIRVHWIRTADGYTEDKLHKGRM